MTAPGAENELPYLTRIFPGVDALARSRAPRHDRERHAKKATPVAVLNDGDRGGLKY
ncbi:hypothetical protein [uncultured Corynebacterium sp.]|uniref:hypothetical protein n=1 Tax=uncultured Corynebacterium sp. TaxID=159447 RepID=UPI00288B0613|nr:hypothetical protein [uncultured Corynebacterium sp.]